MSIKRLVPLNTVSLTADPSNAVAGDIYYNSTSSQLRYFNGTSWVILAGSVNALVDAKSIYQDVRNQSGTSMAVATPVYVSGSLGASNKILISTASNASEATSSKTMGITTSSISDNSNGQVISEGLLEGIDTTGAADGDPVWLGVNGAKIYGLLNKPSAPAHLVFLGIVVRGGSATTGSMYVKIQNGFELQEIHNVEISSLINGNILAYDSITQTWKNTNTLQSTSSTVPLIIRSVSNGNANLQEWYNRSGSLSTYIDQYGNIIHNSNFSSNAASWFGPGAGYYTSTVSVYTSQADRSGIVVRGFASQTANLQEWQNSAGTALAAVTSSGRIWATSMTVAANGGVSTGSQFGVAISSASSIGAVIKGAASQTANLQEWQNSSGTVNAFVTVGGFLGTNSDIRGLTGGIFGGITKLSSAGLTVYATAAGNPGAIIRGAASQTANLTEWQNNSGTVLSRVTSEGKITVTGDDLGNFQSIGLSSTLYNGFTTTTNNNSGSYTLGTAGASETTFNVPNAFYIYDRINGAMRFKIMSTGLVGINSFSPDAQLQVSSSSASTVGTIIKGFVSQTANLQEWQDSNGNVLSTIASNGTLRITNISSTANTGAYTNHQSDSVTIIQRVITAPNLIIKGVASQTAALTQWQSSSANILAQVDAYGSASFGGNNTLGSSLGIGVGGNASQKGITVKGAASQTANLMEFQDNGGNLAARVSAAGSFLTNNNLTAGSTIAGYGQLTSVATAAGTIGAVVRGAASQTANLQEWQNSSGTVLARVSSGGAFVTSAVGVFGAQSNTPNAQLYVLANSITNPTFVAKATASQTSNLTEWQDSAGAVLSYIRHDGAIALNTMLPTNSNTGSYLTTGSGAININSRSTSTSTFNIIGVASQTANLQEWQDSAGAIRSRINSNGDYVFNNSTLSTNYGQLFLRGATDYGAAANINTGYLGTVGLTIRGQASQTANLQEWQNSSGTVLAKVDASGIGTFAQGLFAGGAATIDGGGGATLSAIYTGALKNSATAYNFFSNVTGSPYATVVVKGLSDQTTDLQQWQNSAGTVLVKIAVDGTTTFSGGYTSINQYGEILTTGSRPLGIGGTQFTNTVVSIQPTQASLVGIAVRGAASQTANLTEWQNNAGTVLTSVDKDGYLQTPRLVITNGGNIIDSAGTTPYFGFGSNQIAIYARNAAYKPLIIQGAASQTANLQEWQNDTGTVLASIWSSGTFVTSGRVAIGNGSTGAKLDVMPASSTQIGVTIKSNASQTANLLEFQNSSGTALTYFNSSGGLTATEGVISTLYSGGKMTTGTLGYFNATTFNASVSPVVIRGAASQSTHYIQVQNSSGTLLWGLNSSGESSTRTTTKFGANIQNDSNNNNTALSLSAPSTSGSGIALNVYSGSTTRDMARFDNSGVVKLTITSDGSFKGGNSSTISANTATTVDTVALSSFTTIEYTISIKQGSKIRSSKVLVHTDGTSVDSTEYGIMEMGGGITGILVLASVSSTDSILQITIADATTTNATVKLIKTML